MATASSSEGQFDTLGKLQAELVDAVFEVAHVYISPEDALKILDRLLPVADLHISLLHAEVALETVKRVVRLPKAS